MSDPTFPTWVRKRDGRLVPFDADKVSRALFAATETLGRPDAFLARELADGVVHFLTTDEAGELTTERVREVVVQVVRELGQPELARVFQSHTARPLAAVRGDAARAYSLQTVYSRDLEAAQADGLLTLEGVETPDELASVVLGPPLALTGDAVADLELARRVAGQLVALDGVEYRPGYTAADIDRGLRLTGLQGVVNLNVASPPSWAGPLAEGPLFQAQAAAGNTERSLELIDHFVHLNSPHLRIDWHLAGEDAATERVVRLALAGAPIRFAFDRPRQPVALAEGLDRAHPAALLVAGIDLAALARQPGMLAERDRYLQRLGSLVRLAVSAAVQKRDHVRRQGRKGAAVDVTSGFLLDRARVVLVPVGLDEVVRSYTGWSLVNGGESLELAAAIVERVTEVLAQEGRKASLEACVDGLTAGPAELRTQLRAADALHRLTRHGTWALSCDAAATPADVAAALASAARQTEVVRVRLAPTSSYSSAAPRRSPPAP